MSEMFISTSVQKTWKEFHLWWSKLTNSTFLSRSTVHITPDNPHRLRFCISLACEYHRHMWCVFVCSAKSIFLSSFPAEAADFFFNLSAFYSECLHKWVSNSGGETQSTKIPICDVWLTHVSMCSDFYMSERYIRDQLDTNLKLWGTGFSAFFCMSLYTGDLR